MKNNQNIGHVALLILLALQFTGCNQSEGPTFPEGTSANTDKPILQKSGNCALPSGLIHWWPGDGNANDIAGSNHGTLVGGATFAAGQVGQAFDLTDPNNNDFVEAANPLSFPAGQNFTIAFWMNQIRPPVNPSIGSVIIEGRRGTFFGFAIVSTATNIIFGGRCDNATTAHSVSASIITGQWHHVTVVVDWATQQTRLYVDGIQSPNVGTLSPCTGFTRGDVFRIGHPSPFSRPLPEFNFNGLVDEVQVFNSALTDAEIEALLCRVITIDIDIKPGSDPNSWDCNDVNNDLPVAILSDANFDATTVDANSVRFGKTGSEAAEVHKKNGLAKRHVSDVNKDGLLDMVFHFRFGNTGFSCDDIPSGQNSATLPAQLTGSANGTPIEGRDAVRIVK